MSNSWVAATGNSRRRRSREVQLSSRMPPKSLLMGFKKCSNESSELNYKCELTCPAETRSSDENEKD
jgi:hypothetical protein